MVPSTKRHSRHPIACARVSDYVLFPGSKCLCTARRTSALSSTSKIDLVIGSKDGSRSAGEQPMFAAVPTNVTI